jgi:plastocyanin
MGLGIGVTACGGGDGNTTPPPTTAIAKASANSGDAQTGVVSRPLALPLRVVVTDGGAASVGTTVTWSTTGAGASLNPASAVTDVNGIASTAWTVGTVAGSQTASAMLTGAAGSPVTFAATATPDAATALTMVTGDNQVGQTGTQLADPVGAKVSDQFDNGVPGVDVLWAARGGSVSPSTVPTDADGLATVNVTLGNIAGTVTITATAGTLTGSPLTFNATATTTPPQGQTVQVLSAGGTRFSPANLTIAVHSTVTWNWPVGSIGHNVVPDNGTIPATSGGLVNGPNTYSYTFDVPGTYRYYCANHGGPGGFGMSGTITVQ